MIYWPKTSCSDIIIVKGNNLDKCQEGGYTPPPSERLWPGCQGFYTKFPNWISRDKLIAVKKFFSSFNLHVKRLVKGRNF